MYENSEWAKESEMKRGTTYSILGNLSRSEWLGLLLSESMHDDSKNPHNFGILKQVQIFKGTDLSEISTP